MLIAAGSKFHRGEAHVTIIKKLRQKWLVRITRDNVSLDLEIADKEILELLESHYTEDLITKAVNMFTDYDPNPSRTNAEVRDKRLDKWMTDNDDR